MGIFDRFSTPAAVEHQRPDLAGRRPGEDADADPGRHARRSSRRPSSRSPRPSPTRSVCAIRPTPSSARRRTGSRRPCSRSRKAATISPSRRSMRQGEHMSHGQQLEQTWEQHRVGDGEAQELAPRPERQDRRGEAQEEPARRPPAPRAGAEAHRRNDVVDVREVGVRGVRPDGRAHRDERAPAQGVDRDRRRVHRRPAARRTSSSSRRAPSPAAVDVQLHGAQAEDGHAPCWFIATRQALGAGQR